MPRKKILIALVALVLIVAGGAAWYFFSGDSNAQPTAAASYQPLPTDHTMGNPKAAVTVIEYASPTCPVCANFTINMFPKFKASYIDTGKIFYVYRTFLRGPDDGAAEKLARCMPKAKYMAFTDMLFRNQPKWDYEYGVQSPDGVHGALLALAGQAGMSASDADRCIASPAEEAALNKVTEDGVAKYAINATPSFVINGQAQAGFQDLFSRLDMTLAGR